MEHLLDRQLDLTSGYQREILLGPSWEHLLVTWLAVM